MQKINLLIIILLKQEEKFNYKTINLGVLEKKLILVTAKNAQNRKKSHLIY